MELAVLAFCDVLASINVDICFHPFVVVYHKICNGDERFMDGLPVARVGICWFLRK
ncbi:hypothetical protein D3C72_2541760 [compost metagenome]